MNSHAVLNTSMTEYPEGAAKVLFAMGCFWGVEKLFWQQRGVVTTACGYSGGARVNPTYEQVCTGATGHAEVVLVVYCPKQITFGELLKLFWENHDPTQGMRQGNDIGSQYRSLIGCYTEEQLHEALATKELYQQQLHAAAMGDITTEVVMAPPFYYAERYHQQYLFKNPNGYCNMQTRAKTGLPSFSETI